MRRIIIAILILISQPTRAGIPASWRNDVEVTTDRLDIAWMTNADDESATGGDAEKIQSSVLSACQSLGVALSPHGGLWGSGLFSKTQCFMKGATGELQPLTQDDNPPSPDAPWQLSVEEGDEFVVMTLTLHQCKFQKNNPDTTCEPREAAKISFARSPWTRELLASDQAFTLPLAAALLLKGPAFSKTCAPQIAGSPRQQMIQNLASSLPVTQFEHNQQGVVYQLGLDTERLIWSASVKTEIPSITSTPPEVCGDAASSLLFSISL